MNSIDVDIYPADDAPDEPLSFEDMNYISYISSPGGASGGTYGAPALISEDKIKQEGLPVRVLYINPANIVAIYAVRKS